MTDQGKRLVWMILPNAPDECYEIIESAKDAGAFFEALMECKRRGWVEIFGATDQDPRDILACLQEHFNVRDINVRGKGA